MRHQIRAHLFAIVALVFTIASCGGSTPPSTDAPDVTTGPTARFPDPTEKDKPQTDFLKSEIPAKELDKVVRAHFEGLGHMERYEYRLAGDSFREVHERAPGWIPGSINLAIALLNDTGTQAAAAKKRGGETAVGNNFDAALGLLDAVVARQPDNLNAHYCRGLILEFLGGENTRKAHQDFVFVAEKDSADGHAWYKVGSTLSSPDDPSQPAGPEQAKQLIKIYQKALDCNPYLVTALFKLQAAYSWARDRDKQKELLARWRQLNPKTNAAGPGDTAEAFYGESGKYAHVINPFGAGKGPTEVVPAPKFDPPAALDVKLGAGERWVLVDDLTPVLRRYRSRFGASAVTFDADGDGRADLFLAAAVKTSTGVRDALLINRAGSFDDVSKAWGLSPDAPSFTAAAGDFDADRRLDLFVCGPSGSRLLRNVDGKRFEDVTAKAGLGKSTALGVSARWLDIDQDGDLDLYVVNHTDLTRASDAFQGKDVPTVSNAAFRNDGKPAPMKGPPEDNWAPLAVAPSDLASKEGLSLKLTPWPDATALIGPPANYSAVAALDVDDDRDLDLVLAADGRPLVAVLNDRLGTFHTVELDGVTPENPVDGLLVTDFDKDGRADLVATSRLGKLAAWRNATEAAKLPRKITWETWPVNAPGWGSVVAADLDLDSWSDLVGTPGASEGPLVALSRNDGQKLVAQAIAAGPVPSEVKRLAGFTLADLTGDPLPDLLLLPDGSAPLLAKNLGNGNHWLALDLGGKWKTSFDHMRTNPHGLGTRITVEGQGLLATYDHTTPNATPGQSVGPVVIGLGKSPSAELVRLRWPDGTMQCELNQKADVKLALAEVNRKTGSCPVLFTWNGSRFVCLGDFLGGGGLGYLVAPGVYGQPDRDETVAIADDQLKPVKGVFRLSVTEPMDEVAYLDRLQLIAVDRPAGVSTTPDERFAPEGPRPSGEAIAWTSSVSPSKATDLKGRDVSAKLSAWDRDTVDDFHRLDGWIGYAEEHGIVLDFGDRLRAFGSKDRLVLCLAGWVEYPYSQTNYAAATAGVVLKSPSVERRNEDGSWSVIESHAGYPAGLPRMTTLDLTGKLTGPRCVLRLKTNMECYWDQAFVAVRDREAEAALRQTSLPVSRATLGHKGYSREFTPDGRLPLLYDYDHADPVPLALMGGRLTRHGDVERLLRDDDDQLCLVGPGDEVRLEFDADPLPALPSGWRRSYLLKAVGYCKDADPFTAGSDRVEPLPWRLMPSSPFPTNTHRPDNPIYRAYLETYQTRPAGGR